MSDAMTLERLQVVMEANTKKFNEEIKKVQDQVKSMKIQSIKMSIKSRARLAR